MAITDGSELKPEADEEVVTTPWGNFIRKKIIMTGGVGLTPEDVKKIAAEVTVDILKAIGIIRT